MKKTAVMSFKQKVYCCCLKQLDDKIQALEATIHDLKAGSENDTKSSAGDKHETARAMMQMEHEKISRHLNETKRQKNDLEKIDSTTISPIIINGSLIKSNNNYFFLGVALGKIIVEEMNVMALSLQSPLGQKLAGMRTGDSADVNGIHYVIEEVK